MKIVIKIGGQAAVEDGQRRALAGDVARLSRAGHRVVVVHGGGKLLTETLARLGIPTEFQDGLRVTDAATCEVALMVLAGVLNKRWVAELEAQGQPALGLCGGDAHLVTARRLARRSNGKLKDLGFVGRPQKVDPTVLNMAFQEGLVPVVASLALGTRGEFLNVNADDFAAALAIGLEADRLIYLTESGGVRDAEGCLLSQVRFGEIRRLIQKGIVRDGMIPKLQSCARTLRHEVGEIDILSPAIPNVLVRAVAFEVSVGTRIVKR